MPKQWAVFISSILMDDEKDDRTEGEEADEGVGTKGLTLDEALDAAIFLEAEIVGNEGPPSPWLLTEDEFERFEATLPKEKPR